MSNDGGRPVTVLGGGITGLSAAYRLRELGHEVTVVDADSRLGGKLITTPFAGRMVDEGADAFLLRVPWALDLCRQLGLARELVNPAARNAYVFHDGELRPFPPQVMGVPTDLDALVATGLLTPAGLARARQDLTAPAGPLVGADVTVAQEITRRLGSEVLDRLVEPLVGGINAGDTAAMSLAAVVPQLNAAARHPDHASLIESCQAQQATARDAGADPAAPIFAAHPLGMAHLVDTLVAALPDVTFLLGRRAEAIEPGESGAAGAQGEPTVTLDDGTQLPGPLVLALPAHATARLLATIDPGSAAAQAMAGIRHTSVALVTLAVRPADVGRALDGSGFLVPRHEGLTMTACSWASSKWAHLDADHGDGTLVLRASAGRDGDQEPLDLDDTDLVAALVDDLGRTMALTGAPTATRITRWIDGFPQYAPGHLDRIAALEADLRERPLLRGIGVAGMGLRGVGIPACIASGHAAVEQALNHA